MNDTEQVQNDDVITIDVLGAIKKHVITAIITLVVVAAAVAVYTFTRTPQYTATSELLATYRSSASTTSSTGNELNSGASYLNSQIQTYPQLVKTESVLQPVIDDLGLNTTVKTLAASVTASNPTDTMLVDISVVDNDPKVASGIANSVAESLKKQVTSTLYTDEGDKIVSPVNLSVVQQAYAPSSPSSPKVVMNLAIGLAAGILLGVAAAIVKDLMDTRIRQDSDATAIMDVPVLGTVTRSDSYTERTPVIIAKPASRDAEEIRRLRMNVSY